MTGANRGIGHHFVRLLVLGIFSISRTVDVAGLISSDRDQQGFSRRGACMRERTSLKISGVPRQRGAQARKIGGCG